MFRCGKLMIPVLVGAVLAAGCQSGWKPQQSPLLDRSWMASHTAPKDDTVAYGRPDRMAVIWTDSVASASDRPNVRGFGGRIYFYDTNGQPIRVDGDLSVYAYDDSSPTAKAQADRVYKFRRDEWQGHFSETSLGPSYSVWIPWDPVGGDKKTISLLPVFKSAENQIVKSGQSINVLPGKTPLQIAAQTNEVYRVLGSTPAVASGALGPTGALATPYDVRQALAVEPSAPGLPTVHRATTISVPRPMAQRLHQDLRALNVDGAMPGSHVQVSYGDDALSNAAGAFEATYGPAERFQAIPPEAPTNTAKPAAPVSRPVFGAPGALK